ncbi:hypothetical protein N9C96_02740, partial [bacterium]|nr:hypothetical protein [bacterium]
MSMIGNNENHFLLIKKKIPGQVLVTTILILMIISLTVLAITSSIVTNSRQVNNNISYNKSYNLAETKLLNNSDVLSTPDIELSELIQNIDDQAECALDLSTGDGYICRYEESGRITLMKIFETNFVENLQLATGEYFDVILSENGGDSFDLSWVGETALSLQLIYEYNDEYRTVEQIVDPSLNYYSDLSSNGGFLSNIDINDNFVSINFNTN